jgi:hypothetical protein
MHFIFIIFNVGKGLSRKPHAITFPCVRERETPPKNKAHPISLLKLAKLTLKSHLRVDQGVVVVRSFKNFCSFSRNVLIQKLAIVHSYLKNHILT